MAGWTYGRKEGKMDGWIESLWMDAGRMAGWMYDRKEGRKEEWMDG